MVIPCNHLFINKVYQRDTTRKPAFLTQGKLYDAYAVQGNNVLHTTLNQLGCSSSSAVGRVREPVRNLCTFSRNIK